MSVTVKGNVITWLPSNAASGNSSIATFYIIQYTMDMYDWVLNSKIVRTTLPMVELIGLVAGGKYRVRVKAGNSGGVSDWSDSVMFTATALSTTVPGNTQYARCVNVSQ